MTSGKIHCEFHGRSCTLNLNVHSIFLTAACSLSAHPLICMLAECIRTVHPHIFSVDYLLPVQIGDDWVGVVYRDGAPAQALMDLYDITNKAILCDPAFDTERVSMFENPRYHRLRIVPDLECSTESVRSRCSVVPEISDCPQWTPTPSPESFFMEMSPTPTTRPSLTPSLSNSSSATCTPRFVGGSECMNDREIID